MFSTPYKFSFTVECNNGTDKSIATRIFSSMAGLDCKKRGVFSRESRRRPSSLVGQLNYLDLEVDAWGRGEAEYGCH